jgi:PadR family transcriptional regulator
VPAQGHGTVAPLTVVYMFYRLSNMDDPSLGELEFIVLLTATQLGDDAYGAQIRRAVIERTRREYSVGAIYESLRRLEAKGFLTSSESEPLPVRGGRARRCFMSTPAGRAALRQARLAKRRFWDRLDIAWRSR